MALLLRNGSIFLHLPKTGGNWVSHVLHEQGLVRSTIAGKHADTSRVIHSLSIAGASGVLRTFLGSRIRRRLPVKTPFMFTFVRNPVFWYESWFKYQSQSSRNWRNFGVEGQVSDWHPNAVLNGLGDQDFNVFVRRLLAKRPGYVTELFFSYTTPEVAFVGKQESVRQDLCRALELANERFDRDHILNCPPIGVSAQPSRKIAWDPEVKKRVIELERAAIVRFGYDQMP